MDLVGIILSTCGCLCLVCVVYSYFRLEWLLKRRLEWIDKHHEQVMARSKVRSDFSDCVNALREPLIPRVNEDQQNYLQRIETCTALWTFELAIGWQDNITPYRAALDEEYLSYDEMCNRFWVWDFEKLRRKR